MGRASVLVRHEESGLADVAGAQKTEAQYSKATNAPGQEMSPAPGIALLAHRAKGTIDGVELEYPAYLLVLGAV